jgi:sigma-B regulation protein RsbU (phosphoserine phosphatase)
MVLSQEGRFLVHPDQALVLRQDIFGLAEIRHQPELANLGRAMTAGRNGTVKIEDFATGQSQWVVYAPLPRVGWSIAATVNEPAVLAPVHAAIRRDIAILFLGSIPVVLVVMVMALRITRPIKELAQTVRQIAAGNLNLQPPKFKSRDEIGEFANAFGMMVSELRRHVDELTKETANREAVESELRVGRSIQAALLPSEFPPYPDRPEIDLYALNKPAKQVAGDFFDFFFVDEETLAVVIADVSGKGVPAALMMAVTRTLLRSLEIQKLSPAQAMERINRAILRESAANMFVTLFLGYYNTRSGEIRYVNAGHNPPYKLTTQGKAVSLGPSTAPLLGVFEDEPFEEGLCRLEPGEYLLLYTDGLTEARSPEPEDQMLGDVRFQRLIEHAQPRNAEHLCLSLLEILERFQGYALHDDMTLVALRRCVVPALEPPGNGQAEALGDEPADVETEETSEAEAEPDSGLLHEQAAATSALHGHNSAGSY